MKKFPIPFDGLTQVLLAAAWLLTVATLPAFAQEQDAQDLPTPPRIGMASGSASFWRPGASDWSAAQVNTPLSAGDALYTAAGATLEVQIGSRAYLRLAQNAMLSLLNDEPALQQFKITSGIAAFDVRGLAANRSIEIDTPSGAFNIDSAGYYRIEVTDSATHFIARRGGEATVTLADGNSRLIAPSQEAVIETGDGENDVDTYVAPDTDAWDGWNTARTDDLLDAISNRYVSPEVYGTDDLDHYGNWRTTSDYGAVWVPSGMPADWAPYSSGSWVWDPVYAWTWVDTAPWGWAPYHYGRWVNVNGYWAWAPGPRHYRPAYAPALVAFFHGSGGSVQVSVGGPAVSWVALGWGEPCLPWWGRGNFVGRPWWGGWAGPRVVNNVVIQNNTTVINNINVNTINYRNIQQRNAAIAMSEQRFGRGRIEGARRIDAAQARELRPIVGQSPVRPEAVSFAPSVTRAAAPATNIINRSAVVLHNPSQRVVPWRDGDRGDKFRAQQAQSPQQAAPENRVVTPRPQAGQQTPWARFGQSAGQERRAPRRAPDPPRIDTRSSQAQQQDSAAKPAMRESTRVQQQRPIETITGTPQAHEWQQVPAIVQHRESPAIQAPAAPTEPARQMPSREARQERREQSRDQPREQMRERTYETRPQQNPQRELPGQPANRVYQKSERHQWQQQQK